MPSEVASVITAKFMLSYDYMKKCSIMHYIYVYLMTMMSLIIVLVITDLSCYTIIRKFRLMSHHFLSFNKGSMIYL